MTTIIECTMRNGRVVPLDAAKVEKWKTSHKDGEVFDMILDDGSSSALTPLAKRFFATRDEYAQVNGYDTDYATIELKYLWGVRAQPEAIPEGRNGKIVHIYDELWWVLSIRDYTNEELSRLVQGSEMALQEAST